MRVGCGEFRGVVEEWKGFGNLLRIHPRSLLTHRFPNTRDLLRGSIDPFCFI